MAALWKAVLEQRQLISLPGGQALCQRWQHIARNDVDAYVVWQPLAVAAWLRQLVMQASSEGRGDADWACAAMAAAARTARVFKMNIVRWGVGALREHRGRVCKGVERWASRPLYPASDVKWMLTSLGARPQLNAERSSALDLLRVSRNLACGGLWWLRQD